MMPIATSTTSVGVLFLACAPCFGQSCFEVHSTPGCDDAVCEKTVCNIDSFCCTDEWDATCVEYANKYCSGGGGGGNCDDAPEIDIGDHFFDTSGSTDSFDLTGFCDPGPYGDDALYHVIWFKWNCDADDTYILSTCNQADYDTRLAVLAGTCEPTDVVECLDDTDGCAGFSTRMGFEGVAGTTYLICVGGYTTGSQGTGTLSLGVAERQLLRSVNWTVEMGAPEDLVYEAWAPALGSTTWSGCRADAEGAGDHLVSVTSAEENAVVTALFAPFIVGLHAFGLYQDLESPDYSEPDGGWAWTDGTPLSYTNWQSGEPNDWKGLEHYGQINGAGDWNDNYEDNSVGWTAYAVKRPGSPFSYTWPKSEGGNGHRYEAFGLPISMTLAGAIFFAEERGGHLVTINSFEEQNMLINQVIPELGLSNRIALGLVQNTSSPDYSEPAGGWEWVTGEPLDYLNWNVGEPNDLPAGEDIGELLGDGTWNDVQPTIECLGVIIEYEDEEPECPPDLNGDGKVDGADLTILLGTWGAGGGAADLNGDGTIDGADLTIILAAWGDCP